MAALKIFRETALPTTLVNDSIYIIAPAAQPNYIELYVTNSSGAARRIIDQDAIQTMITNSLTAANQLQIAANITARNALAPTQTDVVYVIDATGDSTVNSGGATYLFNPTGSVWIKVSEAESMDVQLTWAALQNRPASTVAAIDSAVSMAHSHSNKTQLDTLGVDGNGNITVSGNLTHIGWDSTNW